MMVSPAAARALADIASRASDVMRSFYPGAVPLHHDSAAAGPTQFTNDPLTVAAPKNAYFITCGEGDRHMYTRDGQFHVHGATLVDRDNQPLMGPVCHRRRRVTARHGFTREGARFGLRAARRVHAGALFRTKRLYDLFRTIF